MSKVIVVSERYVHEFDRSSHLHTAMVNNTERSLLQMANTVYDKKLKKFIKQRDVGIERINQLLDLTKL